MAEIETKRTRDGPFAEGDWVDRARQQVVGEQRDRLEGHLGTGCRPCRQTLRVWQSVLGLATQEASYEPPDGAVGKARAVFAFRRPQGLLARLGRSAAPLFNRLRQPPPAGGRAAGAPPPPLPHHPGRYLIMSAPPPPAAPAGPLPTQ